MESSLKVVEISNKPDLDSMRKRIIDSIEKIVLNLNQQLVAGTIPTISSSEEEKKISFGTQAGRKKLALILQVLQRVHLSLVLDNRQFQTRRSLFYELKEKLTTSVLVKNQRCVDKIVRDVAEIVSCLEWNMNIVATSKGLAAGKVICTFEDGSSLDFNVEKDGVLISQNVFRMRSIKHDVKMMIVVEKDAVFQKLLSEGCPRKMDCILVTGKGYPDYASRTFVKVVSETLNIPVYIIVDADPFGIDIMCMYRFGSSVSLDQGGCPKIKWIGIHPSEIDGLKLQSVRRTALSKADQTKLLSLEKRTVLSRAIKSELKELKRGKLEIEAIADHSEGFMSTVYLPLKINKGWFID